MALSRVTYTGNGVTQTFSLTFNYLSKSHIKAFINGVEDVGITFPTNSTVTLSSVPAIGALVLLQRVTPTAPIVDFVDGSNLTEVMLDTATNQAIYIAQEAFDGVATSDAISEAVTSASVSASNALASANAAATSQATAFNNAVSAANSAFIAQEAAGSVTLASQEEAEAGTDNNAYLSSLRTFQAITAKAQDLPTLNVKGNTTLGDAGTDTATLNAQLSAGGGVGTSGQFLKSRGTNSSPIWDTVTIPSGSLLNIQYFTSLTPVAYAPTAGTNFIIAEVVGGGGGGEGGSTSGTTTQVSGIGGQGGSYAYKRITSGFSGATVTVGGGGTGGTGSGGNGGGGGTSSLGSLVTAGGGAGGGNAASVAGTSGDINVAGASATSASGGASKFGGSGANTGQGGTAGSGNGNAGSVGNAGRITIWEFR